MGKGTIEISHPRGDIEKIEERHFKQSKVRDRLIGRVSSAKNFRAYLSAQLEIIKKDKIEMTNTELIAFMEDMIKKYDALNPAKELNNLKLEIEILGGWKGESETKIYMGFDNDINILIPQKNKLTGVIKKNPKVVLKEDINRMIKIVKNLELNKVYTCYEIADMMGLDWKNDIWRNRTRVYFKSYYFPIKILEAAKLIEYGDGTIKRLK